MKRMMMMMRRRRRRRRRRKGRMIVVAGSVKVMVMLTAIQKLLSTSFDIFSTKHAFIRSLTPCGEGKWDEACLEALQSEAPHTGPSITPRCICAGAFPIPTAPTSGFVTSWQMDQVIIPRYTGIPTRKWWGKSGSCACGFHTCLTQT